MTPEQLKKVRRIFLAIRDMSADRRAKALEAACGPDHVVRVEVEQLLAADAVNGLTLPPARSPGFNTSAVTIRGYRIQRTLGDGGQGIVFLAIQQSTGRRVALKVLKALSHGSPTVRARFDREVAVLAALEHPNIVSIVDRGVAADGSPFLAMDFVDGVPLSQWITSRPAESRTPSDTAKGLLLFITACDAVNAAHIKGITHRDLKPANILIDERDQPHIVDFGLAHILTPADDGSGHHRAMTMTGVFMGSLPWSSPEQANGQFQKVDCRSDVYSLGVILYQLVTGGRFPYEVAGTMKEVLDNILTAQPPPPSSILEKQAAKQTRQHRGNRPTGINRELDAIVLKALAKRRSDRYQTAGELGRDLENYLAGRPSNASAPARVPRRISPLAIAVVMLVGALVIGASVYHAAGRRGSAITAQAAPSSVSNPTRTTNPTQPAVVSLPAATPTSAPSETAIKPPEAETTAPFGDQVQIAELEKQTLTGPYDFSVRNQLRHLYGGSAKSFEQINIILQHDVMQPYMISILSDWHIPQISDDPIKPHDRLEAVELLQQRADQYPQFPYLGAACYLKAAELTENADTSRNLIERLAAISGLPADSPYRLLAAREIAARQPTPPVDTTQQKTQMVQSGPPPEAKRQTNGVTTAPTASPALGTIFVDARAKGAESGESWNDAYRSLAVALHDAHVGSTIHVAEGVYTPTPSDDRSKSFELRSGVSVIGGYAGLLGSTTDDRDIKRHPTVLSGDIGRAGDNTDNSYHVVTASGTDETAVLDGVTISGGTAEHGDGRYDAYGAGLLSVRGSPTLTNCTFISNSADDEGGGAIYDEDTSAPVLDRCLFSGNSGGEGGAIFNQSKSAPRLSDCILQANRATNGGGGAVLNLGRSTPQFKHCTFSENKADSGAAILYNDRSAGTIDACTFARNTVQNNGAAIDVDGTSTPAISQSIFASNKAGTNGGAIFITNEGAPTFSACVIEGNSAEVGGGAIFSELRAAPLVMDCLIVGNYAGENGGAVFSGNYRATTPTFINCTFTANRAGTGAGGALFSISKSETTVVNCILWENAANNAAEIFNDASSSTAVSFSDIEDGYDGDGNIQANPEFRQPAVMPPNNAPEPLKFGNLLLRTASPCLGTANASAIPPEANMDVAGHLHLVGTRLDMGAYQTLTRPH